MEDSFFEFDTSLPNEDDRGGRRQDGSTEGPEEEYDALNDETFGSAINGDWEDIHENLVRLDCMNGSTDSKYNENDHEDDDDEDENSDLEINLSRVKLDDVDVGSDDNECGIQLDPSVWANPIKTDSINSTNPHQQHNSSAINQLYNNPENFLRQHFPNPFENLIQPPQPSSQASPFFGLPLMPSAIPSKICTVEDIERNIRQQQQQQQQRLQQQQHEQQQKQAQQQESMHHQQQKQLRAATPKIKPPTPTVQSSQQQPTNTTQSQSAAIAPPPAQIPPQLNGNFFNRQPMPPNFNSPRPNFNMNQHPLNVPHPLGPPQPQHRMPHGFPPMSMMGGHQIPPPHPNFPRVMSHNLPVALNNFAMHPNFNAMRPVMHQLPPQRLPPQPPIQNQQQQNLPNNANQFNQRLMQEIQQNHPMLTNTRGPNMYGQNNTHHQNQNHHQKQGSVGSVGSISGNSASGGVGGNNKINLRSNGNVPDEFDEYANLMSTRDKHWLIGIQLSQLNTDTPYIDDYYYTVYKDRKAKLNGDSQSKAHKDNQLNHPLTQPKGHAKLVLIQMGKNGTNNRNGQNNRERRNSSGTTKNDDNKTQRTYTPLQFENSLGKLQYGSVTAPRKIIDMDIMGNDGTPQFNTSIELSAQRKSRQILLHIETVYKIVLKLEDLENPTAIATSLIVKDKKEKEKQLQQQQQQQQGLERQAVIELIGTRCSTGDKTGTDSDENSLNSSLSDRYSFELESKDKLIQKLLPCLTVDKVIGMMTVRKGKTLIRRIMPHIESHPIRWNVWIGVFTSLQAVLKKDKDDNEGVLYAIYPEFKKQIALADFDNVIKIANSMPLNDKKINSLFGSKFCISSLVALILRAEELYSESKIEIDNHELNEQWSQFLSTLSSSLNRTIQHQTISAAIESDAIKPMVNHFSRFKELKLDSLLTLFSEPKQEID